MKIRPSKRLEQVSTYYFAGKLAQIASMRQQGKDVLSLGIGSPDLAAPPEAIDRLRQAALEPNANQYQSYTGLPELRAGFTAWYARHFEVELDAKSELLPLVGSKEGIMHISMSFLGDGDVVLVPNPGYPAYSACAKLAGAEVMYYNLTEENGWLPDLEAIKATDLSRVKIMWINYPHMPTGAKASLAALEGLVKFCSEHEILLCHDNPYSFILNDEPLSIFKVKGAKEIALELVSLSKSYNMSGWRVGAVAGHAELIKPILRFKSNMDSGMYKPIQQAAVEALAVDNQWFENLNQVYRLRREYAYRILDLLNCVYDKSAVGLFVWGKIPDSVTSSEEYIEDILQNALVFITPGFIFGSNGARYIRISLCANEPLLAECEKRITQWVSEKSNKGVSKNQTLVL